MTMPPTQITISPAAAQRVYLPTMSRLPQTISTTVIAHTTARPYINPLSSRKPAKRGMVPLAMRVMACAMNITAMATRSNNMAWAELRNGKFFMRASCR